MSRRQTTVAQLANEAGIEVDEALLLFWDSGFPDVTRPQDIFSKGKANRARRALHLATRKELRSSSYWVDKFGLESDSALKALLAELGVTRPFDGRRLRATAIRRLRAKESQQRHRPQAPPEPDTDPEPSYDEIIWTAIGRIDEVIYLSFDEVCAIHERLVLDFSEAQDPIYPCGVRSRQLLDSALSRPDTAIGDERKYPTIEMAAAALLHSLVHDHPFHNGNKRTALVSMLSLLDKNGMMLTCPEDGLFKLVLQLAKHSLTTGPRAELPDREVLSVATWLRGWVRRIKKGDRPLAWRRLKQILVRYDCELSIPGGGGNRINITRHVLRQGRLFRPARTDTLHTQVAYTSEGSEVSNNTINKIRRELEIDDDHNVDSAAFYDRQDTSQSEFIQRYRKTLRRLARL